MQIDIITCTALDFREYLGGEEKINAYCRNLARDGGRRLAEMMGTEVMSSMSKATGENELMLNMVRFLVCWIIPPLDDRLPATR
jgi:hypothetical protein